MKDAKGPEAVPAVTGWEDEEVFGLKEEVKWPEEKKTSPSGHGENMKTGLTKIPTNQQIHSCAVFTSPVWEKGVSHFIWNDVGRTDSQSVIMVPFQTFYKPLENKKGFLVKERRKGRQSWTTSSGRFSRWLIGMYYWNIWNKVMTVWPNVLRAVSNYFYIIRFQINIWI